MQEMKNNGVKMNNKHPRIDWHVNTEYTVITWPRTNKSLLFQKEESKKKKKRRKEGKGERGKEKEKLCSNPRPFSMLRGIIRIVLYTIESIVKCRCYCFGKLHNRLS
jgi:hypothetical protein